MKLMLGGKFRAQIASRRKRENSKNNNIVLPKKLEKQGKIQPKVSGNK